MKDDIYICWKISRENALVMVFNGVVEIGWGPEVTVVNRDHVVPFGECVREIRTDESRASSYENPGTVHMRGSNYVGKDLLFLLAGTERPGCSPHRLF